jgi:four helix bundle protein
MQEFRMQESRMQEFRMQESRMQNYFLQMYYLLDVKRIKEEKQIMKTNIIKEKSFDLSKEIVFLYHFLIKEKHEYILSKQLLRAGTSVGANTAEGVAGQSRKDFCHCLNIAYKEARETFFWLSLLKETNYLTSEKAAPVLSKCDEVIRILCSILKTTNQNT